MSKKRNNTKATGSKNSHINSEIDDICEEKMDSQDINSSSSKKKERVKWDNQNCRDKVQTRSRSGSRGKSPASLKKNEIKETIRQPVKRKFLETTPHCEDTVASNKKSKQTRQTLIKSLNQLNISMKELMKMEFTWLFRLMLQKVSSILMTKIT